MEIGELIHKFLGYIKKGRCPFCPESTDTETYRTYPGSTNNSTKLRTIMNNPGELVPEQSGCRAKDGVSGRQGPDTAQPSPNPIYNDSTTMFGVLRTPVGDYGNEAHHSISGKECMEGEAIENIIRNSTGEFEGQTGYSINNAVNGVYLPSWHRARFGSTHPDGKWGDLPEPTKYNIMKVAMRGGAGQAHIGSHTGKTARKHPRSYPDFVKRELQNIHDRVRPLATRCPLCNEDGNPKTPLPTPYGVNEWLDVLSRRISGHLKSHPRSWQYFVSQYAADYHAEVCRHKTLATVLPDNWPPV